MRYYGSMILFAFLTGLFFAGQALGSSHEAGQTGKAGGAQMGQQSPSGQEQLGRDKVQFGGGDERVVKRGQGQIRSEDVKKLQEKLKEHGHETGPVDGLYGPKTEQALREYQQSQGIAASGEINRETLESLGLDSEEFFGISPQFQEQDQQRQQEEQQMRERQQPDQMLQQQEQQTPERKY